MDLMRLYNGYQGLCADLKRLLQSHTNTNTTAKYVMTSFVARAPPPTRLGHYAQHKSSLVGKSAIEAF